MLLVVCILKDLVFMKGSFLAGDNIVQFYPWFKEYAARIKDLSLPFWTRYMQSGFPLMAEGQLGGFYPVNVVFFWLLPFKAAYNYIIVFQFLLAGISIFYLTKKLGGCVWGGAVSSLIFCFGSAFAGCFYNIITLRTLSWVPLVILLFEHYFEKKRYLFAVLAGVIFGFQLLAGFVQMAVYCGIFYSIYFLYRSKLEGMLRWIGLKGFALFCLSSGSIFLPQLLLTYQLVDLSARSGTGLSFAVWGSYNPIALMGAIFPYWSNFLICNFSYIGFLGVLFVIAAAIDPGKGLKNRPFFLTAVIFVLLALGKFNPVYVLALKITGFCSMRFPAKFMFFTLFSLSVLAGKGFTLFFDGKTGISRKAMNIFIVFISAGGAIFLLSKVILNIFGRKIIDIGTWYVKNHIYANSYHRGSLDEYISRVQVIFADICSRTSFHNKYNVFAWILIAMVFGTFLLHKKNILKLNSIVMKKVMFLVLGVDLLVFSSYGIGFKGNIADFSTLEVSHKQIFNAVSGDTGLFRIMPWDINSGKLPVWSLPNANMAYKIDSIACYTPLAISSYSRALSGLELIDSSLGLITPGTGALVKNIEFLRVLNVKYIISANVLKNDHLRFLLEEDGVFLYELSGYYPRFFIVRELDEVVKKQEIDINILGYGSGYASVEVDMPYDGFLVFSETYYPGWEVRVDGKDKTIQEFKTIQAVELESGMHKIVFKYTPYGLKDTSR